ncbi:RHS repeat-associated core domain-containing protein [Fluviicola chungangensis]|uniref:RHS repeat-associated core domain-containing protein n=1 Tax=Fluviicola chungangensis TaxID=2597671 RepID=UPI00164350F2|nr:RHS repeat-associated core domain-containing protein [Fluviicola chungangensis]
MKQDVFLIILEIEQSPNGTSSWSTMINILSTNGTNTQTFTPTQPYVRVKFLSGNAYSLADLSLVSVDVDTSYSLIARSGYRYGFNSMEKDDELKGEGNSYDFGARLYDPRVGRWLSIDPQTSKQPSFSPYKAFLNSPIIFKDPDGEDEYLVIIIKNEKTGAQLRLAVPEPISNKLRAGNIREAGNSTSIYETQNYYDYKTVFTITIGADGKTSEDIKQYTLTNSKRYTKTMFSSIVSGVRTGAIVDPDGWDLEQAGGFYMTGENGQGTKYHSKNADYVGNIDQLLSILSNYKKSPEFKISGTLTKDDPNGLWLMIGQLTKSMTKQGEIIDKGMEIVDEVKGNGGGDDSSSGDSTEVHVSKTGAVKKPGIYTYKQSNSSIKAGETPNKSNSRLIKSPQ